MMSRERDQLAIRPAQTLRRKRSVKFKSYSGDLQVPEAYRGSDCDLDDKLPPHRGHVAQYLGAQFEFVDRSSGPEPRVGFSLVLMAFL